MSSPPIFVDYRDALEWIAQRSEEVGGQRAFSATPEYAAVYPLLQALYKEQKAKSDHKIQQEFAPTGLVVGDAVEQHAVGAFLTQIHLTGTLFLKGGVPFVQVDPNPFTSRKQLRWNSQWRKAGSRTASRRRIQRILADEGLL